MRQRFVSAVLALACAGCSFTAPVRYVPVATAAAPGSPIVVVTTANERPSSRGGRTDRIGNVRGGYNNPFPVHERSASDIERAAREMTVDALAQAGVATADAGGRSLVATVNEYWIDGAQIFYANVEVEYALKDATGAALWQHTVNGSGGDAMPRMGSGVFGAETIAGNAFGAALREAAEHAAAAFRSEDFQRLVQREAASRP